VQPDEIELVVPPGRAWLPVARLVLGGIADRLDLGFEELDDLQLAVERLLVEAGEREPVHIGIQVLDRGVRVAVGPLREAKVAKALQGPESPPGELDLRRILDTVVDSFAVEDEADGAVRVLLQKANRAAS
jgi:hypothetical protein